MDLQKAIEQKAKERKKKLEADTASLVENDTFMELQARLVNTSQEIEKLDKIIHQLNTGITPFIAKDGSKYSVRVFPVSQFGVGLDKLVGIITGSATAFTDDMAAQYEAIVGVPFVELQLAREVLGTVPYVNRDGEYVEGTRNEHKQAVKDALPDDVSVTERIKAIHKWEEQNAEEFYALLKSIAIKLKVYEIIPSSSEELLEKIRKWEANAERRASRQLEEIDKAEQLDVQMFTIDEED